MIDLKKIKYLVEVQTGIKDIATSNREQHIVDARTIYIVLCNRLTNFSFMAISETINRHHSSISHALNKIYESWKISPNYYKNQLNTIDSIEKILLDMNPNDLDDNTIVKTMLTDYEVKLMLKNKMIDQLNKKIEYLEKRVNDLKKYEPIW